LNDASQQGRFLPCGFGDGFLEQINQLIKALAVYGGEVNDFGFGEITDLVLGNSL